jgi:hypothetical protein
VFVLPTPMRHDLENTGKETLRAVAFFAAAMFTQDLRPGDAPAEEPHSRDAEPRGLATPRWPDTAGDKGLYAGHGTVLSAPP